MRRVSSQPLSISFVGAAIVATLFKRLSVAMSARADGHRHPTETVGHAL